MTWAASRIRPDDGRRPSPDLDGDVVLRQLRLAECRRRNGPVEDVARRSIAPEAKPVAISDVPRRPGHSVNTRHVCDGLDEARDLMAVGEAALRRIDDILTEISVKITRTASGVTEVGEREAASAQLTAMVAEIDAISAETRFDGVELLTGGTVLVFAVRGRTIVTYATNAFDAASLGIRIGSRTNRDAIDPASDPTCLNEVETARVRVHEAMASLRSVIDRIAIEERLIPTTDDESRVAFSRGEDAAPLAG